MGSIEVNVLVFDRPSLVLTAENFILNTAQEHTNSVCFYEVQVMAMTLMDSNNYCATWFVQSSY